MNVKKKKKNLTSIDLVFDPRRDDGPPMPRHKASFGLFCTLLVEREFVENHIIPICGEVLISAPPSHIASHSSCPVLSRLFVEAPARDGVLGHKLWFLNHPDKNAVYLAIGSGNLTARDWRMTESFWGVELPVVEGRVNESLQVGARMWREAVATLLRSAGFPDELWAELVYRSIDWSAIPSHVLPVWSVPGEEVHADALKMLSPSEAARAGVQIQVSNIGSVGIHWLETYLFPEVLCLPPWPPVRPANTEIVYPSHESMMRCDPRDHHYIYQNAKDAVPSLMVDPATDGLIHHAKVFEVLGSWVMIGSHNLSVAAWGAAGRTPRNYELSVVFGGCTLNPKPYPAFGEGQSVGDPWTGT